MDGIKMGQRDGFSRGDVKKLRNMYNCTNNDKDVVENKINNKPGGLLSFIFGLV